MVKPIEQDVILDADGKPLFDALSVVRTQIDSMLRDVQEMGRVSQAGVKTYGAQLRSTAKEIQQSMSQMQSIVQGQNNSGYRIKNATADRKLGKETIEATQYMRSIQGVGTAIDALTAKQNTLTQAIAARGRQNKFETVAQTKQRKGYEEQINLLKQLDRQMATLDRRRRSSNLNSKDQAALNKEYAGVSAARARVENAALDPSRINISRELTALQTKLDNYANYITTRRQMAARRVADERRTEQQLTSLRNRSSLDDRKVAAVGRAKEIQDLGRLNTALGQSKRRLTELRAARRAAATPQLHQQRTRDIQVEVAYIRQLQKEITLQNRARDAASKRAAAEQRLSSTKSTATKKPPGSGVGSILTPSYAGAALARTAVYGGAAGVAYGAFNAVRGGASFTIELEDSLARLQAISASTDTQMQTLGRSILNVANSSRYSTAELVKVSTVLAQAGITAGQMEGVLKSVINLATASGSTAEESVQLVTSAIGAFQLQAGEAGRVADLMTVALNRTKLTVQQTGLAIQYVGASAYENNISLEQLLATSAALAQAGIKSGSTIGTGFRRFLVDLKTPTEKLTKTFDRLGLAQADVDVKTRGLQAVLETLRDAGFGANEAYEGLETRSAAFYLVAKNNIDIIDQLQLAFTTQNASAIANAKAMESTTAQWQRFKNIMGDIIQRGSADFIDGLTSSLRGMSDVMDEINQRAIENDRGFFNQLGTDLFTLRNEGDRSVVWEPFPQEQERDYENGIVFEDTITGLFTIKTAAAEVTDVIDEMETSMNQANDKFNQQTNLMGELEKEYQRLLVQKDSLIDNDLRAQTETLNLMNRFEGLSGHLTTTTNQYYDLITAVEGYIAAQNRVLSGDIATLQGKLSIQNSELRRGSGPLANKILNDDEAKKFTGEQRGAIKGIFSYGPGTNQFNKMIGVLGDIAADSKFSLEFRRDIQKLAESSATRQANLAQTRSLQPQRENADFLASTTTGREFFRLSERIDSLLTQAAPLKDKANSEQVVEARTLLTRMDALLSGKPKDKYEAGVLAARAEAGSLRQRLEGMVKADNEIQAERVKEARAERRAKEREAKRDRMVTLDMPFSNPGSGYGKRKHPISGKHRMHKGIDFAQPAGTPIKASGDGVVKEMRWSNSYGWVIDIDHGGGTVTRYAHMQERPKDMKEGVQVKRGQQIGKVGSTGRSTGPHLHWEVLRNGSAVNPNGVKVPVNKEDYQKSAGRYERTAERNAERFEKALNAREVRLSEEYLTDALEDMTKVTTKEAYEAAAEKAEGALKRVNDALRTQALAELSQQGFGPGDPSWDNRMAQVEAAMERNVDEYNEKIAKGLLDNLEDSLKAAEQAFNRSLAPAQRNIKLAEAQSSGLNRQGVKNKVPDYVRVLAQDRVDSAGENLDRQRFANLPGYINEQEKALANTQALLTALPAEASERSDIANKMREQRAELEQLRTEYEALGVSLEAGAQIPQTYQDGIQQAIEAYRIQNELGRSFKEEVIFNMYGGLEQAHQSINQFFTDIFTGSKNALDAFGDMALGMLDYLAQMAAQFVANQVFSSLLKFAGIAAGSGLGGSIGDTSAASSGGIGASLPFLRGFTGGRAADLQPVGLLGGGRVTNGTKTRDSVHAFIARDEWVVQKSAVDSVGNAFMADLNANGAEALDALQTPAMNLISGGGMTTNVYVVADGEEPSMGPNDVLVVMHDDLLNGTGRRLVKSISQGA